MNKNKSVKGSRDNLKKIYLLILDVEGVLTPPYIIWSKQPNQNEIIDDIKRFNVHDGSACWVAREAGLNIAIISGRDSEVVRIRAQKLKIEDIYLGHLEKMEILEVLKKKYGLKDEQIAFVSDDFLDLPLLEKAGFPIAVNDAMDEVKNVAKWVTESKGGCGAVREVIKRILTEQGKWESSQKEVLRKIARNE